MKVRIVGVGANSNEKCILSGENATGYIDVNNDMVPCKLSILGDGIIGGYAEIPKQYEKALEQYRSGFSLNVLQGG